MALSIKTEGLSELSEMFEKLAEEAETVASEALYEGAKVVADSLASEVKKIRAEPQGKKNKKPEKTPARYPTPEEKAALASNIGIAKFKKNGSEVDTIIGVGHGYMNVNGKKKAVALIARSINSGTSFMHKQPFIRKAVNKSRAAAKAAIIAKAEEKLNEITNK